MPKIKVLIVDDHDIVRNGMHTLLKLQHDMEVVGEAADCREAIKKVRDLKPDVVILDISMPDLNGLDAIWLIADASPDTAIIIFSMHMENAFVHQAFIFGARGYTLKSSPVSELPKGIRAVYRGERYLDSNITIDPTWINGEQEKGETIQAKQKFLSPREEQILRLIVQGKTSTEAADILCVTKRTVEKHREHISKKMGTTNIIKIQQEAIKRGIIEFNPKAI